MVRFTRVTGIVLIVLGIVYFVLTGSAHPTSLIPALFGVILLLCGVISNTDDTRRQALWMHIAVTVGLLGFLFPAFMGVRELTRPVLTPTQQTAANEQIIMAAICLVFTAFCVRTFVVNRRTRAV